MDGNCVVVDDQVVATDTELNPSEVTLLAMGTVLVELIRAVEAITPSRFDRALQLDRLRLQQIQTGLAAAAFPFEDEILRKRIDLFERGQGREPIDLFERGQGREPIDLFERGQGREPTQG